jgi:hypothetical protein
MTTFKVWLKFDKDLDAKICCGSFPTKEEAEAHLEHLRPSLYSWEELIVEHEMQKGGAE